jgi:hypothetical protein
MVEFMQRGTTMSEVYCQTLKEPCTAGHSEQGVEC